MWNDKEGWRLETVGNVAMFVDFSPNEAKNELGKPVMENATVVRERDCAVVLKWQKELPYCVVRKSNGMKKHMSMDMRLGFEIRKAPKELSLETLGKEIDKEFEKPKAKEELKELNDNLLSWKLYENVYADEIERVMDASQALAKRVGRVMRREVEKVRGTDKTSLSLKPKKTEVLENDKGERT